ncbi:MAG: type I-C CRISPR-associated protein Cas8c/Csd1 [Peptococcaceae bacterium]|nr:type I-C CRISPR-associated protein Cas8c/Csd1 [Peptococcaceae bacterium]
MLHELAVYARKNGLSLPSGFKAKTVRWIILLGDDGEFISVDKNERTFAMCPDLSQPELIAGGVTRSQFLIEAVSVAVGMGAKEKEADKHRYFAGLLREAARHEPRFKLCADLLDDPVQLNMVQAAFAAHKAKPTDKVTFKVGDTYLVETDTWHGWWQEFRRSLTGNSSDGQRMRCLISGEMVKPAEKHFKIMGLLPVGGLTNGSVLIGFDKDSFTSYGLKQSRNAACSEEAAAAYRNAFEHLLKKAPKPIAGAMFLHWYKEPLPTEDDLLDFTEFGADNEGDALLQANRILNAAREGNYPHYLNNRYYILQISGAGGRVMVRDWLEGEYMELVENIRAWFDDLEIIQPRGNGTSRAFKLSAAQLRMISHRKNEKISDSFKRINQELAPVMPRIWRSIVQRHPLPDTVPQRSLLFIRSRLLTEDEDANLDQIACSLLKAWYNRKTIGGEYKMNVAVNPDHPSPAYHAGRMMAVLALIQRKALGDVGANVVQRYYASASSTPSLVLGRLVRQAQYHLDKIEEGLSVWYERKLQEISSRLGDGLPTTLTLEEQTLFALGYYQQRADMFVRHQDKSSDEKKGEKE